MDLESKTEENKINQMNQQHLSDQQWNQRIDCQEEDRNNNQQAIQDFQNERTVQKSFRQSLMRSQQDNYNLMSQHEQEIRVSLHENIKDQEGQAKKITENHPYQNLDNKNQELLTKDDEKNIRQDQGDQNKENNVGTLTPYFDKYKDKIYKILENYSIKHLKSGGQGDIFVGKKDGNPCVFKIIYKNKQDHLEKELELIRTFKENINVIEIIGEIKGENEFLILILPKYEYSLFDFIHTNFKQINEKNQQISLLFDEDKLIQVVFDLLDGLIQFRIFNILHLDIKPQNILVNKDGQCIYTDFGISHKYQKDVQYVSRYYTENFASPEQENYGTVEFESDVYSLGITFQQLLLAFDKNNKENELSKSFRKIIDELMVLKSSSQRSNCLNILNSFFQIINKERYREFLLKYKQKIQEQILKQSQYDDNKDMIFYQEMKKAYSKKLIEIIKTLNLPNSELADAQSNLGLCYARNGKIQEGLKYLIEYLNLRKEDEERNSLKIMLCLSNIVHYYTLLFQLKEAEEKQEEYLKMINTIEINKNYFINLSHYDIGLKNYFQGQTNEALKLFQENLKNTINFFKLYCPSNVQQFLKSKGIDYENICNFDTMKELKDNHQIEQYFKKIVAKYESLQNIDSEFEEDVKMYFQRINGTLNHIGLCMNDLGEIEISLAIFKECLEIENILHKVKNNPNIASSLNNIGMCLFQMNLFTDALTYNQNSLSITKNIFKENNISVAQSLNNVGLCLMESKVSFQKAVEYLEDSVKMAKDLYKGDHIDIARSLNNIGVCFKEMGNIEKALTYLFESLQMGRLLLTQDHYLILAILNNIGICYRYTKNPDEALIYLNEAYELKEKANQINIDNSQTSKLLNNIGLCYKEKGEFEKSLKYLLDSLNMRRRLFKEDNSDIADSTNNIAECFQLKGDNINAEKYFKETLSIRNKLPSEIDKVEILFNMGLFYVIQQKYEEAYEYLNDSLVLNEQINSFDDQQIKEKEYDKLQIQERCSPLKAQCRYYIGIYYFQKELYQDAIKYLLQAHSDFENLEKKVDNQKFIVNNLFYISQAQLHLSEGTEVYVIPDSDNMMGGQELQECFKKENIEEAIENLKKSLYMGISFYKEGYTYHVQFFSLYIAYIYIQIELYEKAIDSLKKYISLYEQQFEEEYTLFNEIYYCLMGECYQLLGQEEQAQECQKKLINLKKIPKIIRFYIVQN